MAISLVVYSFDKQPVVDDVLFYLGHIPNYSGVLFKGKVYEGTNEQSCPFYNVFRIEDELVEDDNLYVLFVFNSTTDVIVHDDHQVCIPPRYQDAVCSEVADWMMMVNGTEISPSAMSNGNFLFTLKGVGGQVNSMFSMGRRKHIQVVKDV